MSARASAASIPRSSRARGTLPPHICGFSLTCVPGAAARRSGSVRPGAAAAAAASSSPAPPPSCRTRLPGVSSCCSRSCGSAAQLLPLSGGGQLGDAPATAPALRIRRRHAPAKLSQVPAERSGAAWTLFHGTRRARAHTHPRKQGQRQRAGLRVPAAVIYQTPKYAPCSARTRPHEAPIGPRGTQARS